MVRDLKDFSGDWQYEAAQTAKLFSHITPEALNKAVAGYDKTVGELGWHLVESVELMSQPLGFEIKSPISKEEAMDNPTKLADAYLAVTAQFNEAISKNWTNEQLTDVVKVWGMEMPKGAFLASGTKHQNHHRGQMTVLMRQTGCTVCGMYGPAKEEWAAMGMPQN